MAYNFRNRNLLNTRGAYLGSSGSDSDSQDDSDPDFRTPSRNPRRSTQNNAARAGGASYSRNLGGKRSRGANGEEHRRGLIERHRRRRKRRFSQVPELQISKRTVLSWLIGLGVIEENEVVWYVDAQSGNILGEGKVNREGILCSCCTGQISVEEFEVHSGRKTRKPYQHIYLAGSQLSLLDCQIEAWEDKEEEERRKFNNIQPAPKASDRNDDACMICADGGDLICCERCPSTFHTRCLFMETIPQGDWLCPYCVCKYCGNGNGNGLLKQCSQCEKLYHSRCGGEPLDLMNPPVALFCGPSCREIYEGLHKLLGSQNELHDGLTWTLLQRTDEPFTGSYADEEYQRIQCNSKIAVAWLVMNECFLSTIDRHTRANIVQSIVYNRGSNVTRINYSGFYTAILEKDDEIVSVASIRVHGKRFAEMPFIGTRGEFRRLGMAFVLENCIESTLCSLHVEKLVIPSVNQLTGMWMNKYFFSKVEEGRLEKELSLYNTVMFPSSVVKLQKTLTMLPDLNLSPPNHGHF